MKSANPRIKRVFTKKLESVGKPLGQIMREEGYADNTADNPQRVTETKSWEMLLEEYLPDDLLTKVAKEGLGATMMKTSYPEADRMLPDFPTRQRYLDTALKMKGKLVDKTDITSGGETLVIVKNGKRKYDTKRSFKVTTQ